MYLDLKYPILKYINNNHFIENDEVFSLLETDLLVGAGKKIMKLFKNKPIDIYRLPAGQHKALMDVAYFKQYKENIYGLPDTYGLLLLPETVEPVNIANPYNFRPGQLKMNAILFAFTTWATYDIAKYGATTLSNGNDLDDEDYQFEKYQYERTRWLNFFPIQLDKIYFSNDADIFSEADEYGMPYDYECRQAYGNIADYVWSFIINLSLQAEEIEKYKIRD